LYILDSVLEYDKKGAIWLVTRICHLAPIQDIESPGRSVLYNIKTNEIVFSCTGKKPTACRISPREIEVLILISDGLLSKHIAERLSISLHTVHNHRASLLKKLQVNNAAQAVNKATNLKII
jgi:DNA-binding NarL/FixJ family response regulator